MNPYYLSSKYYKNIYSQYGEDGVIEKIIFDLNLEVNSICEFGAWDGMHCSNTFNLGNSKRKIVMIEGDPEKFKILVSTAKKNSFIIPVLRFVELEGANSLDNILNEYGFLNLDLLSIDIDGFDLKILKSFKMKPTVIITEFNPTFGVFKEYEGKANENIGNSFMSIYKHFSSIGYSLVSHTKTNLFFVRTEVLKLNGLFSLDLSVFSYIAAIDQSGFHIASGYDGRAIEFGNPTNPWDGCRLAKVYKHPEWAYGWTPTRLQVAYRALRTLSFKEIIRGVKKAKSLGWFNFF